MKWIESPMPKTRSWSDNNQEADNEPGSAAAMLSQSVVSGNNDNDQK